MYTHSHRQPQLYTSLAAHSGVYSRGEKVKARLTHTHTGRPTAAVVRSLPFDRLNCRGGRVKINRRYVYMHIGASRPIWEKKTRNYSLGCRSCRTAIADMQIEYFSRKQDQRCSKCLLYWRIYPGDSDFQMNARALGFLNIIFFCPSKVIHCFFADGIYSENVTICVLLCSVQLLLAYIINQASGMHQQAALAH